MKGIILLLLIGLVFVNCDFDEFSASFTDNEFTDLDGWTAINSYRQANVFNTCDGSKLVGGDGVFGHKSSLVKNFKLPPHFKVQIKLQMWKIDSWDNEKFHVFADDQKIFEKAFSFNQGEQLCGRGGNWGEVKENIDVTIDHVNPTLNVVFTSSLDQHPDDESWAVRDFHLLVQKCPEACDACSNGNTNECKSWELYKWSWTSLDQISAEGWKVDNANPDVYECAGIKLLGGFNVFGKGATVSRVFEMEPHYRIKVKLTFAKIDSWDNEEGSISLDGEKIWARRFQYNEGYTNSICGAGHNHWTDFFVGVDAEGKHTGNELEVKVTSTLDQGAADESWGIRDFFLYFAKCAKSCEQCTGPTPVECTKCQGDFAMQEGECKALHNFVLIEQEFMKERFSELAGWELSDNVGGKTVSDCGGTSLVGGFGIFGVGAVAQKTWELPSHKRLRIQVQLWKIDSWDDEFIFIKLDGQKIWEKQIGFASGGRPICGQGHANWNELIVDVDLIVEHSESKANIAISTTLNQHANDESWGFREFKLFYEIKEPCAILYPQCNYEGSAFEFCGKSSDFRQDSLPTVFKSIKLPPGSRLTIYEQEDYGGKKVTYSESQPCLEGFEFSLLQKQNKLNHPKQYGVAAQNKLREQK